MWENFRVFFEQSWLAFRALYGWLDPKVYVLTNVLTPVLTVVFFGLAATHARGGEATWAVLGNSVVIVSLSGLFGSAVLLSQDRGAGTLPLIIASPRGKFFVFAGRTLFYVVNGLVMVVLGLFAGWLVFGLDFSAASPGWMALAALACVVSVTSAGLAVGSVGLCVRDLNLLLNLGAMGFMALCGVNFPVAELPAAARFVSYCLPLTRGLQAYRLAFAGAAWTVDGRLQMAGLVSAEFAVAGLYLTLGYLMFLWLERRARVEGKFDFQA